jgi:plastocyanin
MQKKNKLIVGLGAVALCGTVVLADDATHTINQKDKTFSQSEITVKVGDSISFVNQDAVVHNVFSTTPGMEFDLRTQQPGKESTVPFTKEGTCEVRCAIHPKMKLTVKVEK